MNLPPSQWENIYRQEGRIFTQVRPAVMRFAELLVQRARRRVLDLGCGNGLNLVYLARQGLAPAGLDNAPSGLRLSQEWLAEEGLEAPLILADIYHPLPFQEAAFEAVLSTQVIHHARMAQVQAAAGELRRVVCPGGLLLVSVPFTMDQDEPSEAIEPGTFVPTLGGEAGLPHHIFAFDELPALFAPCNVIEHAVIEARIHLLIAERL